MDRPPKIDTREQALDFARKQVEAVKQAVFNMRLAPTAGEQQKLYQVALLRQGNALGTMATLLLLGQISDIAYESLRQQVMATMTPKLVKP